ncbi:MAG: GH3 auxin-responsive promoter family protein [Crocinitomicaceae bacterium]
MPFNTVFSWLIGRRMTRINDYRQNPFENQRRTLQFLLKNGSQSDYGKKVGLKPDLSHTSFQKNIPLSDYGSLKSHIEAAMEGKENQLWPGKTPWFAKSSGTTADRVKILPITTDSLLNNHYAGGKDLLAQYYHNHSKRKLYNAKHLIIGGSGKIDENEQGIFTGDLSAIIINNLPTWTELRRTPKKEIALLENWEEKLEQMAASVLDENICIIAGIPSWTLLLLKKVLEKSGKSSISEVWPNLELYIHGGMSFKPYQSAFDELLKIPNMHYVESYNSSEGYFGLQDQITSKDLLLLTNSQVYFEFIPMSDFEGIDSKKVLSLEEITTNVDYALVISTSAGLWRYIIGDTVQFRELNPFRFIVSGRTSHYMNAFGEKLIIEHAEKAISTAAIRCKAKISDYTAAPYFHQDNVVGGHHWLIEFDENPEDDEQFLIELDQLLKAENADYEAKRKDNINIGFPKLTIVPTGTFHSWLKSKGKLGGQHKVPRLMNDPYLINEILSMQ